MKTEIAGIKFDSCVLNASGAKDTTEKELEALGQSDCAAIVIKTATIDPRDGNPEPRCTATDLGLIQSMGWPNLGYKKYVEVSFDLKKKFKKPIIASVGGFFVGDYQKITAAFQDSTVDLIEISLSCPNLDNHPQIGYDFDQTDKLLASLVKLGKKPLGLKLPPYLDSVLQEKMAEIIRKYKISFITCINSIGNALIIDPEKEIPIIKPREGFGGLCGDYIKPVALGNVRGFYNLLKNDGVSIIGVGGIKTGADVFEFLLAGADAVEVGSSLEKEGTSCFARINKEFAELMEEKGYGSIEQVKGRLKKYN